MKSDLNQALSVYGLNEAELNKPIGAMRHRYNRLCNNYQKHSSGKQKLITLTQRPSPNYNSQHQQKLNHYGIFKNRYYHTLEDKQARKYRMNHQDIISSLSPTKFYVCMTETMRLFNEVMHLFGKSTDCIDEVYIEQTRDALSKFEKQWMYTSQIMGIDTSLGAKYHYLSHCVAYMDLWKIPLGFLSEQSIEGANKVYGNILKRYKNQRGLLKIKYSMHQLLLITSPTYQSY